MSDLPDEILLNIFSEFEPLDILPFRRVCKRWKYVIDTSTKIQLQVECLLDGRDLPAAGNSWAGELQRIRQSNLAWETLTPTKMSSFGASNVKGRHLQFYNGLVAMSHESDAGLEMWEYHDVNGFQNVAKHAHIGIQPSLYAFNRAQDVLVLVEDSEERKIKLHVRKLSTDGQHQGAAKATMILECNKAISPARIEIHGVYVSILVRWRIGERADNCFFLVNWKEGTILLDNLHSVWDFCFIDAHTILLAVTTEYGCDCLQVIPLKSAVSGIFLDLPSLQEDYQHYSLELKTDGGRLIGLCVGIDMVVRYAGFRDSDSDYLLVIDRPGLLKFLAAAKCTPLAGAFRKWAEWEPEVAMILPLENNSYQMAWAVFGRRIVINAVAKTLPFVKSALALEDENETHENRHKTGEDAASEDSEDPHSGERLVVVDFGSYRLSSAVEAGDESGNIIRCRPQKGVSLVGVYDISSNGLPFRSWTERVPSCLPSDQVHMSENMVLVCAEKDNSIRSIRVF